MLTKQDLGQIKKIVDSSIKPLKADVMGLKADVKKIDKKVDKVIDFFDHEVLSLVARTKRIETHLNIQPLADF